MAQGPLGEESVERAMNSVKETVLRFFVMITKDKDQIKCFFISPKVKIMKEFIQQMLQILPRGEGAVLCFVVVIRETLEGKTRSVRFHNVHHK